MDFAVRTEGLTKVYGRKFFRRTPGIVDLNLQVRRGEVFGYLGPNGSGKTTTLRCLLDLLRPTHGRAVVLGCDPRRAGPALRRRVGYLPGDLSLEPQLTADQLFDWLGHLRKTPSPDRTVLVERLELDPTRPLRTLSKGNRQKVGIIQALMHRPELVVLDEPTTGLDPIVREEFQQIVREGREVGRTFLLSSHAMDEVQSLADRIGILRKGQLVLVDSVRALCDRASRCYEVLFRVAPPRDILVGLPGIELVQLRGCLARLEVAGSIEPLLASAAPFGIQRVESTTPDLTRIFLSYYEAAPRARARGQHAA